MLASLLGRTLLHVVRWR